MMLVTGGGGFIGSHLTRALVRRGERVRVLDNSQSGGKHRLADVLTDIEWIDGDICDRDVVTRACEDIDTVFHQAAVASVSRSVSEPVMTHDVNVNGTLNILMAARAAGVRRVVYASSSAVYGDNPATPKVETLPAFPTSPYGVQKLSAELYCSIWHDLYGVETVSLRYFNVFGAGQDPHSEYAAVIPRFISAAIAGDPVTIYGSGKQSRDFIHVSDVVAINMLAAKSDSAVGKTINAGSGKSITILTLVEEIGRALGRELDVRYDPPRMGDLFESVADITQLTSALGYEPQVGFSDGVALTVEAFQKSGIL
jgi:UDP-glucose 4-epimerase